MMHPAAGPDNVLQIDGVSTVSPSARRLFCSCSEGCSLNNLDQPDAAGKAKTQRLARRIGLTMLRHGHQRPRGRETALRGAISTW